MSEGQDLSRNPQAKKFFQNIAEELARDYAGLNVNRTVKILKRTATDVHGQRLTKWPKLPPPNGKHKLRILPNVSFDPWLGSALKHMEPKDALRLFETEDLDALGKRELLTDYFGWRDTPLYNLEELAKLTNEFIKYQELDKGYIEDRGYPHKVFVPQHVFSWDLTSLYSSVTPSDIAIEKDVYEDIPREELARRYIVEEWPWDDTWNVHDVARMESERGKLFDLRIRMLKEAFSSLQKRDASDLFNKCLDILTAVLSIEDVEFYLRLDGSFSKFMIKNRKTPLETSGALSAMLVFIGYCEQEIKIGVMAKTREALGPLVEVAGGCSRFLAKSYYSVVDKPERKVLDSACDVCQELEARAQKFWPQYEKRLKDAFEQKLKVRVRVETLIGREHATAYEAYCERKVRAEAIKADLTGKFIPDSYPSEPMLDDLEGLQANYEEFEYRCKDKIEILGTSPGKSGNPIKVNGIVMTIGERPFELFLRLVEELVKDGGGWISLSTLVEENFLSDKTNAQAIERLRRPFRGYLLDKEKNADLRFIENGWLKIRLSTHPSRVTYDRDKLLEHPETIVQDIAFRLPPKS